MRFEEEKRDENKRQFSARKKDGEKNIEEKKLGMKVVLEDGRNQGKKKQRRKYRKEVEELAEIQKYRGPNINGARYSKWILEEKRWEEKKTGGKRKCRRVKNVSENCRAFKGRERDIFIKGRRKFIKEIKTYQSKGTSGAGVKEARLWKVVNVWSKLFFYVCKKKCTCT